MQFIGSWVVGIPKESKEQENTKLLQCTTTPIRLHGFLCFSSQAGNLAGWDFDLRSTIPLFLVLICLCQWTNDLTPIYFPVLLLSSACCFSLWIFISMNTRNHLTEMILDYFEIASVKRINPNLFTLALGKLFGQGQNTATFFTKISPDWFTDLHTCRSNHTQHHCLSHFYQNSPLSST